MAWAACPMGVKIPWSGQLATHPFPPLPSSIQKDSLSLNRLSYWTVIWKFIILTINHFSLNRKGCGVRFHGLGSLPLGDEDTLAWAACPPPQENLTQLNSVSSFLLLNKNPYNSNMAKLIFYVHMHLLLDRSKLRALEACTYARKPDRLHSKR